MARRISPHSRRKTIEWKLVRVSGPGGLQVFKWKTIERTPQGDTVILLDPSDVQRYLGVMMESTRFRKVKIIFQPWEG